MTLCKPQSSTHIQHRTPTHSAFSTSRNHLIRHSVTAMIMSDIEMSTSTGECECHIGVMYHGAPQSPTASIQSLFDGSASDSYSPLALTLASGDVCEVWSPWTEELDSASQQSDGQSQTSAEGEVREEANDHVQDPTLRHAHRRSKADPTSTDTENDTYALRALEDVEHGMLDFRDALSQLRIERADALMRLEQTYTRTQNIVKSSSVGVCVMLHQPMIDPQRSDCGHYFCRDCITRRQKFDNTCPCCGEVVELERLQQVGPLELMPTLQGWKVVEKSAQLGLQQTGVNRAGQGYDGPAM